MLSLKYVCFQAFSNPQPQDCVSSPAAHKRMLLRTLQFLCAVCWWAHLLNGQKAISMQLIVWSQEKMSPRAVLCGGVRKKSLPAEGRQVLWAVDVDIP